MTITSPMLTATWRLDLFALYTKHSDQCLLKMSHCVPAFLPWLGGLLVLANLGRNSSNNIAAKTLFS